jgi:hypothetical protein
VVGKLIDLITLTKTGYSVRKVDKVALDKDIEIEDSFFPDGLFTQSKDKSAPKVKVRALHAYCNKTGKMPSDLTQSEMEQFLV